MVDSLVVYEGPSRIDESEIVAVVTGFRHCRNPKTGKMLQLWILPRHVDPVTARREGLDTGMCGHCPLKEGCYVLWHQAPLAVWKSYRTDHLPHVDADKHWLAFRGRHIRLGAAGDPAALPFGLIVRLCRLTPGHTGYTHQWRVNRHRRLRPYVMASVESYADAQTAQRQGWRTFRAMRPNDTPHGRELRCPSVRVQCLNCGLCNGAGSRKSICLPAHGRSKATALKVIR